MRQRVVVKTADLQDGNGQIDGRFDVRGEKYPRVTRMLVNAQRHPQGGFNVRDGAVDIDEIAAGRERAGL